MDSSSKETLLLHHQPLPLSSRKRKAIILSLFITFILISGSIILSIIYKNNKKPITVYQSHSNRYYCHLTNYPILCYNSISSIINTTSLNSEPGGPSLIFSSAIRVAINRLNNSAISITKALPLAESESRRLRMCEKWVTDSVRRLEESLSTLGVYSDIWSLTLVELEEMRSLALDSRGDTLKCIRAMEEAAAGGDSVEEKLGMVVAEVKLGVEIARKCISNSIELLDGRDIILDDFYNHFAVISNDNHDNFIDYNYNYYYFDSMYWDLIYMYSLMYFFIALLYFVFWRTV